MPVSLCRSSWYSGSVVAPATRYVPLLTVSYTRSFSASMSPRSSGGYRSSEVRANASNSVSKSIVMSGKLLLTSFPVCRSHSAGTDTCPE